MESKLQADQVESLAHKSVDDQGDGIMCGILFIISVCLRR